MTGHLDVQHVSKRFKVDGAAVEALSDISLSVQPREFVSIVGPSGCGKSTLLRLLAGLERGFDGDIKQDGKPISVQVLIAESYSRSRGCFRGRRFVKTSG